MHIFSFTKIQKHQKTTSRFIPYSIIYRIKQKKSFRGFFGEKEEILSQIIYLLIGKDSATNIFPDGKISRPRLTVFALPFRQTHTTFRPSHLSHTPSSWRVSLTILVKTRLRRERDSNSRRVLSLATLAVWCLKPLGHLSVYSHVFQFSNLLSQNQG